MMKSKTNRKLKIMIEDPHFQKTVVSLGAEIDCLSPEDCQKKWIKYMEIETK